MYFQDGVSAPTFFAPPLGVIIVVDLPVVSANKPANKANQLVEPFNKENGMAARWYLVEAIRVKPVRVTFDCKPTEASSKEPLTSPCGINWGITLALL